MAPDPDRATGWHRLADVTGSALTALLVFAAVPAVLLTVVGNPLSGGLGHQWDHTARVAFGILVVVAWVAWAACCAQLTRAVVHHVRRGSVGQLTDAPLTDRIAARIAVGILAMTTLSVPVVVAGTNSGAATAVVTQTVRPTPTTLVDTTAPAAAASYVVKPGDSLWLIAESQLGDGADWTAIAALNLGHTMNDGRRFVDPSLIYAGWDLTLPAAAGASMTSTADVVAPTTTLTPAAAAAPSTPTPAPVSTPTPTTAAAAAAPTTTPAPTVEQHGTPSPSADGVQHRSSDLPELVLLGLGAIGCAALARRARRRRLRQQHQGALDRTEPLSEPAVDADVLLERFLDVPALEAFERANCRLGRALFDDGIPVHEAGIRAICVGTYGVDFWCRSPLRPPDGFELVDDGQVWHLPYAEFDREELDRPAFPVVVPVGDDDDGTWLVPVAPGTCLPLLGQSANSLWTAAVRVQESWSWSALVTVTSDPDEASRATRPDGLAVLYFGDPSALDPDTLAAVSVVTTDNVAATDVSLLVDHHTASIHPLGRTVRPHLVTPDTARLLDELVAEPVSADEGEVEDLDRSEGLPARGSIAPGIEADDPVLGDSADNSPVDQSPLIDDLLRPGVVEIKLLTMTPRMDGLREALPPNRERRAIELVAYLALHRPDSVTSDRLRTRVLGSSDADAAAKTLFNTATAARRAMGTDDEGHPLLPPGTRTGHYRIADAVTVDLQRAAGLAAIGSGQEDPDHAIGYLRAALSLIEGEPLANALAGYTWWNSEGHSGRIAAVLVNAACDLAALAVQQELFELAQWGLERARLLDPYSEALSRAAMQVAAAAGDADRLRREWRECQQRVDELDPGSSPSPRTERLYGELAQQILV